MLDVGVGRRDFLKLEVHKKALALVPLFHRILSSASWTRNVPRLHSLNARGFTSASVPLELVT